MKRLSAWFTLASFAVLGSVAAISCGSDEATGDGGGTIDGGRDGAVERDTGADTSNKIGQACATDAECGEALTCIKRDDTSALGGAPPKGLCTLPCATHDTCLEHSSNAYCVEFERDSYCIEGCAPGAGTEKCHGRDEMVCHILNLVPGEEACETTDDCAPGDLCYEGVCNDVLTACMPSCGSDEDCASGLFCDYGSGLCVEEEPTGKGFNELCDPDAEECQGFCSASYDDETVGTCTAFCSIFNPLACGYTGEGKADSACLFPTVIAPEPDRGDLGLCGQLCDCNGDCSAPGEVCAPFDDPDLEGIWQRAGYCLPLVEGGDFTEGDAIGPCQDTGAGGTGGAGGADNAGTAGSGGTPTDGGAGGAGGGG